MTDEINRKRLGEAVRRTRVSKGWSQAQLAQRAHMKQATLAALEAGKSNPQPGTYKKVCEELDLDLAALLRDTAMAVESPVEHAPGKVEDLMDKVTSLVHSVRPESTYIEPETYLNALGRELVVLRSDHGDPAAIRMLEEEVKHFCVTTELCFTRRVAEQLHGGTFRYACSALIDAGVAAYLADSGWMLLLRGIGHAQRQFSGDFSRLFFVTPEILDGESTLRALNRIVDAHLAAGMSVGFVDHGDIEESAKRKRNMAWIGGNILLHATDQKQWDLDFRHDQDAIRRAREQHRYFERQALIVFKPGDRAPVESRLSELFAGEVRT